MLDLTTIIFALCIQGKRSITVKDLPLFQWWQYPCQPGNECNEHGILGSELNLVGDIVLHVPLDFGFEKLAESPIGLAAKCIAALILIVGGKKRFV
ncbi:hypothetical protein MHB50_04650 [Siminovitchia sp. FSL H7-0308]|uniref:Uncharacterized protein n=1 Tax=Siminovitchia thermophila TaxID=1245522 RepID=A0ABS2R5C6_9BACI|nr:hypothetical protein [Siminovitchia thermophila]MBM7714812.1 hypothetical protein [Siminovitchia thermophila]